MTKIKLGRGAVEWIEGVGWEDGKDRFLFTKAAVNMLAWGGFAVGALAFSVLAFSLGRMSAVHAWF